MIKPGRGDVGWPVPVGSSYVALLGSATTDDAKPSSQLLKRGEVLSGAEEILLELVRADGREH